MLSVSLKSFQGIVYLRAGVAVGVLLLLLWYIFRAFTSSLPCTSRTTFIDTPIGLVIVWDPRGLLGFGWAYLATLVKKVQFAEQGG